MYEVTLVLSRTLLPLAFLCGLIPITSIFHLNDGICQVLRGKNFEEGCCGDLYGVTRWIIFLNRTSLMRKWRRKYVCFFVLHWSYMQYKCVQWNLLSVIPCTFFFLQVLFMSSGTIKFPILTVYNNVARITSQRVIFPRQFIILGPDYQYSRMIFF
jgi:hypothetical protein